MDITLPEVKVHTQTARFFRQGQKDFVEISFVGAKDTLVERVAPAHMAQFRSEWNAFCDGRPLERRPGTPLTELPSINDARAAEYVARNVHNLEELAALNDSQCQALGHGTLTDRKHAIAMVATNHMRERDRLAREVKEKQATVGAVVDEKATAEIETLKADVSELKQGVAAILAALEKRKGGRPKKEKAE